MSGFTITRRTALALSMGGVATAALPAWARGHADDALEAEVDAIVAAFMARFATPGLAVAVVRPDAPPLLKGYGVRAMGAAAPVDAHTRFGIASNSKAFTAAALALLVDDDLIGWDDPVTRHLHEFRMHDAAVTQMMTVRDLLTHRSGLPLGAGDLMFFPTSSHVAKDVLKALPHLRPARGFRAGYDYDNILYIVAGLLIERVSGDSWEDFVAKRLLAPLGMADAVPSRDLLETDNVAGRHARLGPPVRGMGAMQGIQPDESAMMNAAGGIQASVTDIAQWLRTQLAFGALPDGTRLWSRDQAVEMWTPQTITGFSDGPVADYPTRPVMSAYALGWFVQDYRGERLISHSGGLAGQVTQTAMLPQRNIGIAVFTNTEDSVSFGIRNALLDHLSGAPAFDWAEWLDTRTARYQEQALAAVAGGIDTPPEGGPSLPLAAYAGRYRDPWYGDIVVEVKGAGLWIDFVPTPAFESMLEPWGTDSFRTRFAADAGEDAIVSFAVEGRRVTGVTMKALSPLADFSYDFHHLDFTPVR